MKIQSDLVNEANISEILASTDLILMGCDVLLEKEFLNKTGTRTILEQSKSFNIGSVLVTESRKEITRPDWAKPSSNPLFEWVPLHLIDRIITERSV
jgi:translation initiation factor 2B subunit (eIF-2B alpha/beta/delta family)